MASTYYLLQQIYFVHSLYQSQKTAEKAKISLLKLEATRAFEKCYEEYLSSQFLLNGSQGINHEENNELALAMAEGAYYTEQYSICRQLLEFYFQTNPAQDSFYCRGKILLGLLMNYESREAKGTENILQKKRAIAELLQALEIASLPTNGTRYKFIIYNLSLSFWEIVRPVLRMERAVSFANEFNLVIQALEKQEDNDLEWRIVLLSAGALCADDEKNTKNATDYVDKAIGLLETLTNALSLEETKLLKTLNDCKNEVDLAMNAFREIQEREELLRKPRKIDPDLAPDDPYYTTPIVYPPLQGLAAGGYEKVKEMLDEAQSRRGDVDIKMKDILKLKMQRTEQLIRLHCERIVVNPTDAKRYITLPNVTAYFRTNYLLQVQCILSNVIPDKEWEITFQQLLSNLEKLPDNEKRNETLLDICRTAWRLGPSQQKVARKYMDTIRKITSPLSQILRIKLDICEAFAKLDAIEEKVIATAQQQSLTANQIEGFRISQRIEVIKLMERALTMSVSSVDDKYLVVEVAAILWNILIPLLTTNLNRPKIHSTIRSISTALETIDLSYAPLLKSYLYHELALCEVLADYAGLALVEEKKAYLMDYGNTSKPTETNPNLLDVSRGKDQIIVPFLKSLTLRVDVYGSPQDANAQSILWLTQAKESTSKPFIKDMITKVATLLFEEVEKEGLTAVAPPQGKEDQDVALSPVGDAETGPIDWSLLVMQKGNVQFDPVSLQSLQEISIDTTTATNNNTTIEPSKFSYSLQERLQLLFSLASLAHSIQDTNIFQKAAFYLLQLKWNPSDSFAFEFLDAQIVICCLFADSFTTRIITAKAQLDRFGADEEDDRTKASLYALGTEMEDSTSEILLMKKLAIKFLEKGYKLAIQRKDIYSIQNVMIYFWNLHLHLFKERDFSLLSSSIPEVADLIKQIINSMETVITFPYVSFAFDAKLFINWMNVYSIYCEQKGLFQEALEVATKGATVFTYPGVLNNTSEACYLKKQLFERASRLTIVNAVSGVVAAGGKGGGSKASVSMEALPAPDNPFLAVYSNLAVAELNTHEKVPKEIPSGALEKAWKLLQNEVTTMIEKEEAAEKVGTIITYKEVIEHRLEMRLECYARIARLKIVYHDYVAAQDIAEQAVQLFHRFTGVSSSLSSTQLGHSHSSHGKLVGNGDDDDFFDEEKQNKKEIEFTDSRIYRWIGLCEQYIALAVISFFENSKSNNANGGAALDPILIGRLQSIALQHLHPSIEYSIQALEADVIAATAELVLLVIRQLILLAEYAQKTFLIGNLIIDSLIRYLAKKKVIRHNPSLEKTLRDIFLVLITDLIRRTQYDQALKLLNKAFDVITDSHLQKDLWPAKVVCMSKKRMNVLDGLQKLKETNPLLQAEVLALFARSTNDIKNKLTTYQQSIEILEQRIERVDYMIEVSEVMNAYGFPRLEIKFVLKETIQILNELEEASFEEIKEWEEGDDEELRLDTSIVEGTSKRNPKSASSSQAGGVAVKSSKKAGTISGGESKTASRLNSSQKAASNRPSNSRSRAPSKSGAGGVDPSLFQVPQRMTLKQLEQSCRLSIMLSKIELKEIEQIKLFLKAIYYINRSLQHIINTLRERMKAQAYDALSPAEKETTAYEGFSPSYPSYLDLPNDPVKLLQFVSDASLRKTIMEQAITVGEDLPSFQSFPVFSSTIYHLFTLIHSLKQSRFYDFALIAIAYTKLLLLTTPIPVIPGNNEITNDRIPALTALQLVTYQIFYYQGLTSEQITAVSSEFTVKIGEQEVPFSAGMIILQFIEQQRVYYSQQGIVPSNLLDLSYQDMFQTNKELTSTATGTTAAGAAGHHSTVAVDMNPFHLDTSNIQFNSFNQLDTLYYWMKVIPLLLSLGQYSVAEQVLLVVLFQCRERKHLKFFAETSGYYNQLLTIQGKNQDAIAFTFSQRQIFQSIGDSSLFVLHYSNLLTSFLSLQNYDETKTMFILLLQLLSDLSIRKVVKQKPAVMDPSQSSLFPGLSTNALPSKIGTESMIDLLKPPGTNTSPARPGSASNKNEYIIMEVGTEYLQCLLQCLLFYFRFLKRYNQYRVLSSLNPLILNSEKWEVEEAFQDILQQYTNLQELFDNYFGENNDATKEIIFARAVTAFDFLRMIHQQYSKNVALKNNNNNSVEYNEWLIGKVKICLTFIEKAISVQKLEIERYDQLMETTNTLKTDEKLSAIAPPPPKAFNDAPFYFDFSAPAPPATPVVKVQPPWLKALGQMQVEHAKMLLFVAMLHKQHLSPTPLYRSNSPERNEINIIEKYLKETEENRLIESEDVFANDWISQVTVLANSAINNLIGDRKQLQAKLLFSIGQVANALYHQAFDQAWLEGKVPSPPMIALQYRDQLQSLIKEHIDSNDETIIELLAIATQILIESYGTVINSEANKAAYWIFNAQSLQSKWFLKNLWRKSLNQSNEFLQTIRRMEYFEDLQYPDPTVFKAYQADLNFLKATVPALSIASDPWDIFAASEPFYNQSLFLSLQLCPLRRIVYVAVGKKTSSSDNKSKDPKVVDKPEETKYFYVDKIELSESDRRLLQTILEQYKVWQADMSKFIALNGDNYFENDDLQPIEAPPVPISTSTSSDNIQLPNLPHIDQNQSKSIHQKAERALNERFFAFIHDIETIFHPILGKGSKVYQYLSDYLSTNKPLPTTTGGSSASFSAANPPNWTITMLLDITLQLLPWEAIPLFDELFHGRMHRDFSLHFIGHRNHTLNPASSSFATSAPTLPPSAAVNSTSMKYLIDPFKEDTGSKIAGKERKSIQDAWQSTILPAIPSATKWNKLRTQNGMISLEDFILTFDSSSSSSSTTTGKTTAAANLAWTNLMVYCLGRFGSLLNPKDIAIMNLEKIQWLYCMDHSLNDLSYRRQNSTDVLRKIDEVELETPFHMIGLLSLSGVNCIVMNGWSVPVIAQQRFISSFFKSFTSKEKLIQAVGNVEKIGGKQKGWISFARMVYGIPTLSYSE